MEETRSRIGEAQSNPDLSLYLNLRERVNRCAERLDDLKDSLKENESLEVSVREMVGKANRLGLSV